MIKATVGREVAEAIDGSWVLKIEMLALSILILSSAVELCQTKYIAVYPVVGWWRERSHLGKVDGKVRYALVVSISAPRADVDLYTPIITQISIPIGVEIQT